MEDNFNDAGVQEAVSLFLEGDSNYAGEQEEINEEYFNYVAGRQVLGDKTERDGSRNLATSMEAGTTIIQN